MAYSKEERKEFAEKCRLLRSRWKLTQAELARHIGVGQCSISSLEQEAFPGTRIDVWARLGALNKAVKDELSAKKHASAREALNCLEREKRLPDFAKIGVRFKVAEEQPTLEPDTATKPEPGAPAEKKKVYLEVARLTDIGRAYDYEDAKVVPSQYYGKFADVETRVVNQAVARLSVQGRLAAGEHFFELSHEQAKDFIKITDCDLAPGQINQGLTLLTRRAVNTLAHYFNDPNSVNKSNEINDEYTKNQELASAQSGNISANDMAAAAEKLSVFMKWFDSCPLRASGQPTETVDLRAQRVLGVSEAELYRLLFKTVRAYVTAECLVGMGHPQVEVDHLKLGEHGAEFFPKNLMAAREGIGGKLLQFRDTTHIFKDTPTAYHARNPYLQSQKSFRIAKRSLNNALAAQFWGPNIRAYEARLAS